MSTQAPPGAESPRAESHAEPEVLTTGMEPLSRRAKRGILVALVVAALVAGGFATWRFWPRPAPPFSLADLQNVYAGMVRGDGASDASVLYRQNFSVPSASVDPSACAPLFEETTFSGFPDTAVDGVGTYWPEQKMAVSLFTFRFADRDAAAQQFDRVDQAVSACVNHKISIAPRPLTEPPAGTPYTKAGTLARVALAPLAGVRQQVGYVYTTGDGLKFGVEVFAYDNLVSWQFRYDPEPGPYDEDRAHQVTDSLAERIRFIDSQRS